MSDDKKPDARQPDTCRPAPSPLLWKYGEHLSGSENHHGYYINTNKNKWILAEVMPVDENGVEGKANAELIVQAVNSYAAHLSLIEEIQQALEQIINTAHHNCTGKQIAEKTLARSRALLEGGK